MIFTFLVDTFTFCVFLDLLLKMHWMIGKRGKYRCIKNVNHLPNSGFFKLGEKSYF
jgi:hypothetical protein